MGKEMRATEQSPNEQSPAVKRRVMGGQAFSRWARKRAHAIGACAVPVEITRMACGCERGGKPLQVRRSTVHQEWACDGCGATLAPSPLI